MNIAATVLIGMIVLTIVSLIIAKMIKDKKSHKCSCGCGSCPDGGLCHPK